MLKQMMWLKVGAGALVAIASGVAVMAIQGTSLERRAVFPRPDGAAEVTLYAVKHAWPGSAETVQVRLTTRTGAVLRRQETATLAQTLPVTWASDSVTVGSPGRWSVPAGL